MNDFPVEAFRDVLRAWFREHARDLPWRRSRDPYRVWVSEVMLQQTRVETVRAYYERFVRRFPDVEALAAAELTEVLRYWQGLGYYRRARHLHAAARRIVRDRGGRWPQTVQEWLALPGVGPYMARAVVSIAFGVPTGVVDGNVRRVLARLMAVERPGRRDLQAWADALVDPRDPGTFNQAMMELGATVCTPVRPRCGDCPVRVFCQGLSTGSPDRFPTPASGPAPPEERWWVILWSHRDRWLLGHKRDGLLQDMWLFPMWPERTGDVAADLLEPWSRQGLRVAATVLRVLGPVVHAFTHRRWRMRPVWIPWPDGWAPPTVDELMASTEMFRSWQWFPQAYLRRIPIPRAHRKVLAALARPALRPMGREV
jgi:A/G-specific adenine glycosylase